MKKGWIKPMVRTDGVSFVDKEHFANGAPIKQWTCTKCKHTCTKTGYAKDGETVDPTIARAECTLGFYGPNGNGFNYWCPKCDCRMTPDKNPYSAWAAFTG
jgi:hypothetical protein